MTPQLVNAGTIKMTYPENKAADENFENLRKQYAAGVQSIRYITRGKYKMDQKYSLVTLVSCIPRY